MAELFAVSSLVALLSLTILEIVLGIDNIVFLAIITGKLPPEKQGRARTVGLALAALGRIVLLLGITWLIKLDDTVLFELPFAPPGSHGEAHGGEHAATEAAATGITPKDLILFLGGLFLLGKATWEIGHALEPHAEHSKEVKAGPSFTAIMAQLFAVNLVFSIDSVLTAVGMVPPSEYQHQWVPLTIMITGVVLAIIVMLVFAKPVVDFVNNHPSVKMLALAFLILIGVVLIAESLHSHVPRGYIYFSMGFALFVELLNLRAAKNRADKAASQTQAEQAHG